jgi:hypothetical protein
MPPRPRLALAVTPQAAELAGERGEPMLPLLLWILGVPGLIVILLLLLGVIHL